MATPEKTYKTANIGGTGGAGIAVPRPSNRDPRVGVKQKQPPPVRPQDPAIRSGIRTGGRKR